MSSGQWELVGKGKKDKQNNKKLTKSEKKKFVDNAPKVEDLLPLAQVKSLYSALDNNKDKEPNKQAQTDKAAKTKENEAKKIQKKPQEKKKEKEPVKSQPEKPKNLNSAISMMKVEEISHAIEKGKIHYKGTPIVWLKGLATHINATLSFDHKDVTSFSSKSFDQPLLLLPSDVRNLLKKEIKEASDEHSDVVRVLFDYCLTSMAADMAKGSLVSGYKLFLQLLATQYPDVTVSNLEKHITLRKTYQNKQAVCLSIMWALGQGGNKDISVGLEVWQRVMFPLCEVRSYTRYVLDYLKTLLARHQTSKGVTSEQYFSLIASIFSPNLKIPNVNLVEIRSYAKPLREIASNSQPEKKMHLYFEPLLERLTSSITPLKDEVVRFCVSCLTSDHQTITVWKNLYSDNLPQSACVLKFINSDLNSVVEKLPKGLLFDLISSFKSINDSMVKKNQKGAGLQDCTRLCEVITRKMSSSKKSSPLFKIFLFLFLSFVAIVAFDVGKHGSFKASSSGRFAKDIGIYPYVESGIKYSKVYYDRTYKWSEKNVPIYYKSGMEASRPYFNKVSEYAIIGFNQTKQAMSVICNYLSEKLPFISQWVETYAPGLTNKEFWSNVFDNIAHYSQIFLKFSLTIVVEGFFYFLVAIETVVTWLQKNVFVGNLSSENLQKYAIQGIDTAFSFASKAIFWVQDKFVSLYG